MPLCFYKGPTLIPVLANQWNSKEDFHFEETLVNVSSLLFAIWVCESLRRSLCFQTVGETRILLLMMIWQPLCCSERHAKRLLVELLSIVRETIKGCLIRISTTDFSPAEAYWRHNFPNLHSTCGSTELAQTPCQERTLFPHF